MIMEARFRRGWRTKKAGLFAMLALSPVSTVDAGGWWNHKSIVAVPTGPAVGTVTGAAPYQIFAAPAAAPAVSYAPAMSYAPQVSYAPAMSYAPAVSYAPAMTNAPSTPAYGMMIPVPVSGAQNAFSAAPPATDDLTRKLTEYLKAQAPAAASSQADDAYYARLGRMFAASMAAQAPAPSVPHAMPAYSLMPQATPVAMTPVIVGYSYSAPQPQQPAYATATAQQPAQPAVVQQQVVQQPAQTMSLVPVQLYRQKSFLGHEKLKPLTVYPYGVR